MSMEILELVKRRDPGGGRISSGRERSHGIHCAGPERNPEYRRRGSLSAWSSRSGSSSSGSRGWTIRAKSTSNRGSGFR